MRMCEGPEGGVDLLVLQTEAEWARDLIARGGSQPLDRPTGGFPIGDAMIAPAVQEVVRAIPADEPTLTDSQKTRYSALILILWVVIAIVLTLTVLAMVYGGTM